MAITDIQISDTLETGAPSIKYEGNEGPQDPRQEQMLAQLKQEYMAYVFEQKEIGEPILSFEEWYQMVYQASKMGVQAPQEEMMSEEMMMREPAAYGGIMDLNSGRRRYGLGSVFKKITRPIKKVLKSDLGKAALLAGGIYGLGGGFGGPGNWGLNKGFSFGKMIPNLKSMAVGKPASWTKPASTHAVDIMRGGTNYIPGTKGIIGAAGELSPWKALTAASAIPFTGVGMDEKVEELDPLQKIAQGFDIDYSKMRQEISDAAARGASEIEIKEILGRYGVTESSIDWSTIRKGSAKGGRAGFYAGGQSIPSEYTVEDARKTAMQDRLGGITEIMKLADLYRQGDIGQMYAAQGGRIGKEKGGIMDLDGMEKDYRNTGGFVELGAKEKADDVPARLSKNEFVFTADAVRGAGDGDVDVGAERMENMMKGFEGKEKFMKGAMRPLKSKSGVEEVIGKALASVDPALQPDRQMKKLESLPKGIPSIPDIQERKMAGPDWYIKRIEHLMFLGYSYDEASEIAYDSDRYYEVVGHDARKGASDMFEVSERLSAVV